MKKYLIILSLLTMSISFAQYENMVKFQDEKGLIGYKNEKGDIIVEPIYKSGSIFNQGLAMVRTDKGWTIIDSIGNQLVDFGGIPGTFYSDLKYDLIRHKKDGKWGFIDRKGNLVIHHQYEDTKDFNEGFAPVKINGKWGFIDIDNNLTIKPRFKNVHIFSNGLAAIQKNNRWGFINKNGELVIKPKYRSVYIFSEGLCAVNTHSINAAGGGCADQVIDKNGNVIFTGQFYLFSKYKNGIANYWEGPHFNGKNVFIDKKGGIVRTE